MGHDIRKGVTLRITKLLSIGMIGFFSLSINALAVEPDAPKQLIEKMDAVGIQLNDVLTAKFKSEPRYRKRDHGSLVEFYGEREHKPIWITEAGFTQKAERLIAEIKKAARYGLNATDYDLPSLQKTASTDLSVDALADAELKLSYAALAYARHAKGGRMDPSKLSKFIDVKLDLPNPYDVIKALAESDKPAQYLTGLHPQHEQFQLLVAMLEDQRGAKAENTVIIPDGPTLRFGDESDIVPLLRKRLKVSTRGGFERIQDDYSDYKENDVFDERLEEAVRDFQAANGLKADGIVGQNTRAVLNGGQPKNKVKTIIANMERWRWLPENLGNYHIKTNIPEFKFSIYKNNRVVHSERVIVGKVTNQTPIFTDKMETVVLNPYWYPPRSIIRNEILPGARRSENFISRHRFQLTNARGRSLDPYEVDWYSVRPKDISFRQPPGPGNVLGEVKFLFPNKHAVYMHDTPTKNLFKKQVRAYSHGCVRVQNPRRFTEILLANQGWSKDRVRRQLATGRNQHIKLEQKVPVYLTYFTAWVDPASGDVTYFNDVYKHDDRVIAKLEGRPVPKDPVDPVAKRVSQQEEYRRDRRRYDDNDGFFRRGLFSSRRSSQWDDEEFDPFNF